MCVCGGGGGGGGGGDVRKQFLVKENQVMELWRLKSDLPDPVSDVITIPSLKFLEKCLTPQILQLEIEDCTKKNRPSLDKHY